MTPVEPAIFAAELISRLEKLKQQQETMDCLEERLQQITEVGRLTLPAQIPAVQHPFAEDTGGVGDSWGDSCGSLAPFCSWALLQS